MIALILFSFVMTIDQVFARDTKVNYSTGIDLLRQCSVVRPHVVRNQAPDPHRGYQPVTKCCSEKLRYCIACPSSLKSRMGCWKSPYARPPRHWIQSNVLNRPTVVAAPRLPPASYGPPQSPGGLSYPSGGPAWPPKAASYASIRAFTSVPTKRLSRIRIKSKGLIDWNLFIGKSHSNACNLTICQCTGVSGCNRMFSSVCSDPAATGSCVLLGKTITCYCRPTANIPKPHPNLFGQKPTLQSSVHVLNPAMPSKPSSLQNQRNRALPQRH